MAAVVGLSFDFSASLDTLDLVIAAHQALAKRHGPQFRALERRIEAVIESGDLGKIEHRDLGDGQFALSAPSVLTDLAREARLLGVIH